MRSEKEEKKKKKMLSLAVEILFTMVLFGIWLRSPGERPHAEGPKHPRC